MRTPVFALSIAALLCAQEPKPAPTPASASPTPASESLTSASDRKISYSLDTGYRFVSDVRGSKETYRSVVNLGDGPKLFGADLSMEDATSRWLNRFSVSAHSWGDDPYSTLRVEAEKTGAYRFIADYRNIAYYNFLPSFANPGLENGALLNQRSFDMRRRYGNAELELFPNHRFVPYLIYSHDSGSGTGVTPFFTNGNEFPVATRLRDQTNHFRGGLRMEFHRFHVTLEQGGSAFKDDQHNWTRDRNPGNRTTPIFDQQLFLNDLEQAYGVRGKNLYSKAILTAAPKDWVHFYGQFLYSRPTSEVNYADNSRGLFYLGATRFFNGLDTLLRSEAKMPRSAASAGVELRVHRRLRILEAWSTDRFHNAGSALLAEQFLFAGAPAQTQQSFTITRLAMNYNRQQADLLFDLTSKLTLRGGHRYEWGNASVPPSFLTTEQGTGQIRRHVGIAGLSYRPATSLSANIDYEGSPGDRSYFRTSLQNYHRLRARLRWRAHTSLTLGASFSMLDNRNPSKGIDYELHSRSTSATLEWRPREARRFSILGEYARSTLLSDIQFLAPQNLQPVQSLYRDNAHTATALLRVAPSKGKFNPYAELGGALFVSSGSRPTDYWQPLGRLHCPVTKSVTLYAEWRWYGMSQPLFVMEGFRTHQLIIGLRLNSAEKQP
ncbi:MAG: hypothetical protein JJE04_23590 [Acidobacteriia bacterium]|nr:hypothetical protein [Terriglobia bacterium]